MVNFYNRFIPHAAHLMSPLYERLRGKGANADMDWTFERVQAFEDAKAALADTVILNHSSSYFWRLIFRRGCSV